MAAVDALVERGVLDRRAAVTLRRAASGSLLSVREELRILLWMGVVLVTSGVGALVKQHLDRIGPVALAVAIGVVALACLVWAWRRAPRPGFAFESVLLLGALLGAADLAFVEVKFTPLGPHWPWHLLLVAVAYAALAFRFDSKALFSLALTSFAAWRGVSMTEMATPWSGDVDPDRLLIEGLGCGVLFLLIGKLLDRLHAKAQFEPVAAWLGWLLVVGSLAMRLVFVEGRLVVAAALAGCGAVLAWFAWDERSVGRYALGIAAVAMGLGGWAFRVVDLANGGKTADLAVVVMLAAMVMVLVLRGHRALRAKP